MNTRLVKLPRMAYYYGSDEVDCIALTGRRDAAPTGDPKKHPEHTGMKPAAGTVVECLDEKCTEIKVVKGLGKGLDEKAVECLQKWHFKPGAHNSEPVSVKATMEFNFRLPPV